MGRMTILAGLMLLVSGCLIQETSNDLFLEPDGAVTWTLLQKNVRSDEADPQQRSAEERRFLLEASSGEQGKVRGLEALGAQRIRSRVLREQRPFAVWTEARFEGIDRAVQRFLDGVRLPGSARLTWEGDRVTLTVICHPSLHDDEAARGEDEALLELVDDPESFRIVLTHGRFVDANGFRLEQQDTVAVLLAKSEEEVENNAGVALYSLSWTVNPAAQ